MTLVLSIKELPAIAKSIDGLAATVKDHAAAFRENTAAIAKLAELLSGAEETQAALNAVTDAAEGLDEPRDQVAAALEANK